MAKQSYAIGQTVTVADRSLSGPRTAERFKIVGCYVIADGTAMYRVRSLRGHAERMVPESELLPAMPVMLDRAGDLGAKVLWLFPEVLPFDRSLAR